VINLLESLAKILRYAFFCLAMIEIGYHKTYYYDSFQDKLIIEFLKIGRNIEYIKEYDQEQAKNELEGLIEIYFEELLKESD